MLKCDWCGGNGQVIGDAKSFPGVKAIKCDDCQHEWESIVRSPPEDKPKKAKEKKK